MNVFEKDISQKWLAFAPNSSKLRDNTFTC